MEAASEKPKRGRPRTVPIDGAFRALFSELKTEHALANRYYAIETLQVLKIVGPDGGINVGSYLWLCPGDTGGDRWHWDLLAALGRVTNDATLRIFAERLCELQRPVKESIRLVRQWEERRQTISAFAIIDGKVPPEAVDQWIEDTARTASASPTKT